MCQGICPSKSGPQAGSVEAELRLALAEIQTMATQQLAALQVLRGPDAPALPAAFAMRLIAARAEAGLAEAEARTAVKPVTLHPTQPSPRLYESKCGCRSTADCICMTLDTAASLMYQRHESHRRVA